MSNYRENQVHYAHLLCQFGAARRLAAFRLVMLYRRRPRQLVLVDLCERVWLVVRVQVQGIVTDDDAGKTLRSVRLAARDGVGVCNLVDIGGREGRGPVR